MELLRRQAVDIDGLLNKSAYGASNGSVSAPGVGHDDLAGVDVESGDSPIHDVNHSGSMAGDVHDGTASSARRVLDLAGVSAAATANQTGVDLVLIDTDARWTIDPERFHSKARNTPFGGWEVTGKPMATILDGRLVFSRIAQSER